MTRDVAAVGPEASMEAILDTLEKRGISGVPVVSKRGEVLGVVSEGDLMLKVEHPNRERAKYWRGLINASHNYAAKELAVQLDKVVATNAGHLMSSPAITVHPDASITQAAQIMRTRHVKRLPVVDESGRLIGIVSRADLARYLAHRKIPSGAR
jgi:CBS domain-containing protein